MWMLTVKALYARIPAWLHEADVIGEMLKANKKKPGKWGMDEILDDLSSLNRNIDRHEIFRTPYRKMVGNKEIELKDLENWDITKWLEKL